MSKEPAVPVADLLEELELCYETMQNKGATEWKSYDLQRRSELKFARRDAQKPKLFQGQEVWLRAKVVQTNLVSVRRIPDVVGGKGPAEHVNIQFYSDDIRTDE